MKAAIEETIALVKRGRLELPPEATSDDAWRFFRSGGKVHCEPKLVTAATLREVADRYFAAIPPGAKGSAGQPELRRSNSSRWRTRCGRCSTNSGDARRLR